MQLYSHHLALRIWHPTLDPDAVSQALGFEPQVSWRTGDPRQTHKGTLLGGIRKEGYWSADPFRYGWRDSTDDRIEDAIAELLGVLEPHRAFLHALSQEG